MKASELRIGNLVEYKTDECFMLYEVDSSEIHFLSFLDNLNEYCKPIPLTEETILKLQNVRESIFYNGEKLKGFYIGEDCLFCIVLIDGRVYYYEQTDSENWGYVGSSIDYLHELQNMYYWFNNQKKEIEIKELKL